MVELTLNDTRPIDVLNSVEKYRLVLILGLMTILFFYIIMTGLISLSEKTITLLVNATIAFLVVYVSVNTAIIGALALMAKNLVILAETIKREPGPSVFFKPVREAYKIYIVVASTGIISASTGTTLMGLSHILYPRRGFNIYSFTGSLLAIAGFALLVIAGYVIITLMDFASESLGIPSISWLGKIVALQYILLLISAVPAVTGIALHLNLLLLIVVLILVYDVEKSIKMKYVSSTTLS